MVLKVAVKVANKASIPEKTTQTISFMIAGEWVTSRKSKRRDSGRGRKWEVLEDKTLPVDIVVSNLHPNVLLLDRMGRKIILRELMVL